MLRNLHQNDVRRRDLRSTALALRSLIGVMLLLSITAYGGPVTCEREERSLVLDVPLIIHPEVRVAGSDFVFGCLNRKDDRLVIVKSNANAPAKHPIFGSSHIVDIWFLASDLCAMGHTTKDPAHLLAMLLDVFEARTDLRGKSLRLTVVYGNVCMVRSQGGNKRSAVFLAVLRGWFHALLRMDSPLWKYLKDSFGVTSAVSSHPSVVTADHDPQTKLKLSAVEIYAEDVWNDPTGRLQCSSHPVWIAKRSERWRWFRTPSQASLFRDSLLAHYGIAQHRRALPISVVILRRDEDRHFDEVKTFKLIQGIVERGIGTHLVSVAMHTFDNIRGSKGKPPPPHAQQLRILNNASILIAAHGAGLANIAAMEPGSVVIELFPHNFRYYMYEELAMMMGIKYMAVESPIVWPPRCCSGRGRNNTMPTIHEKLPSLVNGIGARACKKCDIFVTGWEWKVLLDTAVAHVMSQWNP